MTNRQNLLSAIVNQDTVSFLKTKWSIAGSDDVVKLGADIATALDTAPLTDLEKSRRYSLFLSRAQLNRSQLTALAKSWPTVSLALTNALAGAIPPEIRPVLFGSTELRRPSVVIETTELIPQSPS